MSLRTPRWLVTLCAALWIGAAVMFGVALKVIAAGPPEAPLPSAPKYPIPPWVGKDESSWGGTAELEPAKEFDSYITFDFSPENQPLEHDRWLEWRGKDRRLLACIHADCTVHGETPEGTKLARLWVEAWGFNEAKCKAALKLAGGAR